MFKKHLLTAETDVSMVLYPAVCRTFETRPRRKITSDLPVMCSQAPVLFVSFPLKSRVFIGDLYNSVSHCVSFAKAENTLPCFCK